MTLAAFAAAPDEIALRALAHVLKLAAGATYGPRYENLERLYLSLKRGPWRDATLHGCHIVRDGDDILVCREVAAIAAATPLRTPALHWDGRFRIAVPLDDLEEMTVQPVSAAAWRAMAAPTAVASVHALARAALPMLVDALGVAAIPNAGVVRADLARRLKSPILSTFAPEGLDVADVTGMWPK